MDGRLKYFWLQCRKVDHEYERSEFERIEVVNGEKEQYEAGRSKTRILIVDGHPAICQGLIPFINRESDLMVCGEAGNAGQALEALEKQQVDLAIVGISRGCRADVQLAEEIKLQYPNLPVLILSIHRKLLYAGRMGFEERPGGIINQEATEKVIRAIRYVQSLLASQVFGFTVFVKIERR